MIRIIIDSYSLPDEDVIDVDFVNREVKYYSVDLMSSVATIRLNNIDNKYDDRYEYSFFYATNFYNKPVVIVDTDYNNIVFKGIIYSIEIDSSETVVMASNYFKNLVDTVCVYSLTNKTPAEHVYNIITTVAGLPIGVVSFGDYIQTKGYQENKSIVCDVNYTANNNISCMRVIEELSRISNMDLYDENNVIVMKQWQIYNGEKGYKIKDRLYIPGTYKHWYDDKYLYNAYNIAYKTGSTVTRATGINEASCNKYGKTKTWQVPEDNITSTAVSDYPILLLSKSAADNCGAIMLQRNSEIKKYCSFATTFESNYIKLYDLVDLCIENMQNEPVRIIKINNKSDDMIEYIAEYVNLPVRVVNRDYEKPMSAIGLYAVASSSTSIILKWSPVTSSDILGYYIYFTSEGSWEGCASLLGYSPIEVRSPVIKDGNCVFKIDGLKKGTLYKCKIVVFDNDYNESESSNVIEVFTPMDIMELENKYRCKGDMFEKIQIDNANSEGGIVKSDWGYTKYDTVYYGSAYYAPGAVYESNILYYGKMINKIRFIVNTDTVVAIGIRNYDIVNNIFGAWSYVFASGSQVVDVNFEYVQIKVIFYLKNWSTQDYFYIDNIYFK